MDFELKKKSYYYKATLAKKKKKTTTLLANVGFFDRAASLKHDFIMWHTSLLPPLLYHPSLILCVAGTTTQESINHLSVTMTSSRDETEVNLTVLFFFQTVGSVLK